MQPVSRDTIREAEQRLASRGVVEVKTLARLLQALEASDSEITLAAIHGLRRSFDRLGTVADEEVAAFVEQCRIEFYAYLVNLAKRDEQEIVEACLAVAGVGGEWQQNFVPIVKAALENGREAILGDFLKRFDDVRLWILVGVREFLAEQDGHVDQALQVLMCAAMPMNGIVLREEVKEAKLRKRVRRTFTDCWVEILRSDLTEEQLAIVLHRLPNDVIPEMASPLHLADFLIDAYSKGDDLAILALEGLFVLISKHNLDYRDFYPRLYALLTPTAMFFNENRHRFLELAALFLVSGSYLPGALVSAFIKRLCRRALLAPPAGAMWCLRLSLELIRKHPSASSLVHRSVNFFSGAENMVASERQGWDPFDDNEPDPAKSGAGYSSLWELDALRMHSAPAVSRLAEAFSKDYRIRPAPPPPPGDVKDFTALNFTDIFDAEFRRVGKKNPLAYSVPGSEDTVIIENQVGEALAWQ